MGNDSSSHGGLRIVLEKYTCNAGENVKGQIHVSLKESFPPSGIVLMFKGVERTRWVTGGGKHRRVHIGKAIITKAKYVLFTWSDQMNPGDFTVPFEYITPFNIPGSFHYTFGNRLAHIEYYFKVYITTNSIKLKEKQNIHIYGIENYNRVTLIPKSINLVSFCCFKKGNISMNLKWINDMYIQGYPPIECELEVDTSRSLVGVKAITVVIYVVINVVSLTGVRGLFKEVILKNTYSIAVPQGSVLNGGNGGRFQFDISALPRKVEFANIHTSNSKIQNCSFFIEFYLETGLICLCCGDQPNYSSMFFVKPSSQMSMPVIQAPQGWQPTVYRQVSLSYKPEDEVKGKGSGVNTNQTGLDNKT